MFECTRKSDPTGDLIYCKVSRAQDQSSESLPGNASIVPLNSESLVWP